jgi:hypothetical protein
MFTAAKWRDSFQNLVILLLSLSAVMLFVQIQMYNLRSDAPLVSFLSAPPTQGGITALSELPMPVRLAATGEYGRWADLSAATGSENFAPAGNLLMEALGSAGTPRKTTQEEFRRALRFDSDTEYSVYFDFENPLPLSVLAGLVGAEWNGEDFTARRILLGARGETVLLFLWDGDAGCFVCTTALPVESVGDYVSSCPLGSAWFAFDQPEGYEHTDPYSLFSEQTDRAASLTVLRSIPDSAAMLEALLFNPHTNSRYSEPTGAEVIVEGDRTLSIRADGEISYQGEGGSLRLAGAAQNPSLTEQVVGSYRLVSGLVPVPNAGGLYLASISADGNTATLRFGYACNGIPIRFTDGGPAAEITLEGTSVTRLTLRIRQYTAQENIALILPLAQALSISRDYPGRELALCYVDMGGEATVQWLAE